MRLLYADFCFLELKECAHITGIVPCSLLLEGCRVIERRSPAHIQKKLWWLRQLPRDTEAVMPENPELQVRTSNPLQTDLAIWTTLRADHDNT